MDRGPKFIAYQAVQSFKEYLLVAPDAPAVTRYSRQTEGFWTPEDTSEMKSEVALDSVRCSLALAEIYSNVRFDVRK